MSVHNTTNDNSYRIETEELLNDVHADCVFVVEDAHVWVSGMNAHCTDVAKRMAKTLSIHGVPTGLVYDDEAVANGGVQFNYGESA